MIAGDGPDRERLESLAERRRVRFAGRVSEEELADLYARCLAVFYAPVDEDFGMVPYEAFLAEKPVVTTTDAGGPLEVVSDRVHRPRRRAARRGAGRRLRVARTPTTRAAWGRAGRELAERVTWDAHDRQAARDEGRLLLAAAAVAVGDRRLLGAAPAGASRSGWTSSSRGPAGSAGRRRRTSPSTTSATTRRSTAGSSRRSRRRPGVVVLHEFVLHHLVSGITLARGDVEGYCAALEREAGPEGRVLGLRRPAGQDRAALGDARRRSSRSRTACSTPPPA